MVARLKETDPMHEWGLAVNLVARVAKEGQTRGARRISSVKVRIGSLSGVVAEALRFGFEAATAGTIVAPDALTCEEIPAEAVCEECGRRYPDPQGIEICPDCGSAGKKLVSGMEMDLISFTMETEDVR